MASAMQVDAEFFQFVILKPPGFIGDNRVNVFDEHQLLVLGKALQLIG